jgi:phi13 family phage major tail protein
MSPKNIYGVIKIATIGLDKIYYAKVTEDPTTGNETYATPVQLARAISADVSIELAEAVLYSDDGPSDVIKDFSSGTLTLGVDDIGRSVAADLVGATVDQNGVLVMATENTGGQVAIAYRAKKANGKYRYFWLYKVKFGVPSDSLATKGETITFNTPTIEGTILKRNKADGAGTHPWKTEVTEGDPGVSQAVIDAWYNAVYEPVYAAPTP